MLSMTASRLSRIFISDVLTLFSAVLAALGCLRWGLSRVKAVTLEHRD